MDDASKKSKRQVMEREYKQTRSTYLQDRIKQIQDQLKASGLDSDKRQALEKSLKSMKANLSKIKTQSAIINLNKGTQTMSSVKTRAIEQAASLLETETAARYNGIKGTATKSTGNGAATKGTGSKKGFAGYNGPKGMYSGKGGGASSRGDDSEDQEVNDYLKANDWLDDKTKNRIRQASGGNINSATEMVYEYAQKDFSNGSIDEDVFENARKLAKDSGLNVDYSDRYFERTQGELPRGGGRGPTKGTSTKSVGKGPSASRRAAGLKGTATKDNGAKGAPSRSGGASRYSEDDEDVYDKYKSDYMDSKKRSELVRVLDRALDGDRAAINQIHGFGYDVKDLMTDSAKGVDAEDLVSDLADGDNAFVQNFVDDKTVKRSLNKEDLTTLQTTIRAIDKQRRTLSTGKDRTQLEKRVIESLKNVKDVKDFSNVTDAVTSVGTSKGETTKRAATDDKPQLDAKEKKAAQLYEDTLSKISQSTDSREINVLWEKLNKAFKSLSDESKSNLDRNGISLIKANSTKNEYQRKARSSKGGDSDTRQNDTPKKKPAAKPKPSAGGDDAEITDKKPSAPKKPTKAQRSKDMNELLSKREALRGAMKAHKAKGNDDKAESVRKRILKINKDLKDNYADVDPNAHKMSTKPDPTKDANGKRYTKRGVTKMIKDLKEANERGRKGSAAQKKREEDIKRLSKVLKSLTTTSSLSASDTMFIDKIAETAGIETDITDLAQATGLILGIQYRDFQDRNEFYQIVPEQGESRRVDLKEVEDVVNNLDEYGIKDAIIVDKATPRASVAFDATLNNKTYRVTLETSKGTLRITGQYD